MNGEKRKNVYLTFVTENDSGAKERWHWEMVT